jgi:hypothetical protein
MSYRTSPFDVDNTSSQASRNPSATSFTVIVDPFARIIAPTASTALTAPAKDTCSQPVSTYNENYNPFLPAKEHTNAYSPYANKEPLFDDRPVKIANLPKRKAIAGTSKRLFKSWL